MFRTVIIVNYSIDNVIVFLSLPSGTRCRGDKTLFCVLSILLEIYARSQCLADVFKFLNFRAIIVCVCCVCLFILCEEFLKF